MHYKCHECSEKRVSGECEMLLDLKGIANFVSRSAMIGHDVLSK